MKKVFLSVLGIMLMFTTSYAQDFTGEVIYNKITDPSKMMAGNNRGPMGGATMTSQPVIYILTVQEHETSFKADPKQEPGERSFEFNGQRRSFRIPLPKDETYYNLETREFRKFEEYATQPFQISGDFEPIKWRVNPLAQRPILGYNSMMATAELTERMVMPSWDDNGNFRMKDTVVVNEITAWFTDEISSSAGPDKYNGLPGLILALDINGGATTFVASNVEEKAIDKKALAINRRGKKVTPEKFQEIKDDHMEEQAKTRGGRGGRMMMMRHE